ncbi:MULTISPECIES: DNA polymerase III subunit chi [unclassified Neisseria]|uniref:DNA polymerase III subunit chi n=1 Tax=unclassified Neisseria TaxID=2623750 RepID=UPI001071CF50|nr:MULTISPECIES: DNA polymerase III subunit chi [unclassified Neisseria]MBF0803684.1 DNA polymerase III subunit chi [Neisseria sp. 19428wB4_WF04]TFU43594.1 DNA polymerase III subunit chi [Neisseria sp. WF04]
MPKATFYTHVGDPAAFVCRLAERAVKSSSRVLLWADSPEAAERLDRQLWQFDPASFLPHELWVHGRALPQNVPLLVSYGEALPETAPGTIVLNVSADFWCYAPARPARVLEIIGTGLEDLADARERFKAYRKQGFEIEHHNMQGKA